MSWVHPARGGFARHTRCVCPGPLSLGLSGRTRSEAKRGFLPPSPRLMSDRGPECFPPRSEPGLRGGRVGAAGRGLRHAVGPHRHPGRAAGGAAGGRRPLPQGAQLDQLLTSAGPLAPLQGSISGHRSSRPSRTVEGTVSSRSHVVAFNVQLRESLPVRQIRSDMPLNRCR